MADYTTTNMHPNDKPKLVKLRKHVAREKGVTQINDRDVLRRVLEIALEHYEKRKKR